jgi:hypothetical protein
MIVTYAISLVLIGLSGVLLDMHRRSWRNAERDPRLAPNERRFELSQYRRRMQASGMIGVLGVAVGCEPLIPHEPLSITLYGVSLAGASLAILVLAMIDAWATRRHFARLHDDQLLAQFKMARELQSEASTARETAEPSRK